MLGGYTNATSLLWLCSDVEKRISVPTRGHRRHLLYSVASTSDQDKKLSSHRVTLSVPGNDTALAAIDPSINRPESTRGDQTLLCPVHSCQRRVSVLAFPGDS